MKLLAFALSGILAVSSMCGITASASDLYEIPEGISTISELKDYITEPIEISAEDWGRLLANEKDCGFLFDFYLLLKR